MTPEKIPLKARLSWFQVWVPLVLLLYILINGAGHMAAWGLRGPLFLHATMGPLARLRVPLLWDPWALPVYLSLALLAVFTWKLAPQFSRGIRWTANLLGLFLFCLCLLAQGWLIQVPCSGYRAAFLVGNWPMQKRILAWIWKPHMSRPGLKPSATRR